jgi:hypothetical protein
MSAPSTRIAATLTGSARSGTHCRLAPSRDAAHDPPEKLRERIDPIVADDLNAIRLRR